MIKIECGNCRCDLNTGDLIFCEGCCGKLESQVEKLEEENHKLQETIEQFSRGEK